MNAKTPRRCSPISWRDYSNASPLLIMKAGMTFCVIDAIFKTFKPFMSNIISGPRANYCNCVLKADRGLSLLMIMTVNLSKMQLTGFEPGTARVTEMMPPVLPTQPQGNYLHATAISTCTASSLAKSQSLKYNDPLHNKDSTFSENQGTILFCGILFQVGNSSIQSTNGHLAENINALVTMQYS